MMTPLKWVLAWLALDGVSLGILGGMILWDHFHFIRLGASWRRIR